MDCKSWGIKWMNGWKTNFEGKVTLVKEKKTIITIVMSWDEID